MDSGKLRRQIAANQVKRRIKNSNKTSEALLDESLEGLRLEVLSKGLIGEHGITDLAYRADKSEPAGSVIAPAGSAWREAEGVLVTLSGKTGLRTDYPKRTGPPRTPRRDGARFTLAQTLRVMKDVVTVHALLGRNQWSYFITSTYPVDWTLDKRVKGWSSFLDRIRKEPQYAGHVWVRELHPGKHGRTAQTGSVHMHALVRCYVPWNYREHVVAWSRRYNGSPNGLDIKPVRIDVEAYMMKVRNDLKKARDANHELPVRWWGTSRLARAVNVVGEQLPYRGADHQGRPTAIMYVPKYYALALCAAGTDKLERRAFAGRLKRLLKRYERTFTPSEFMTLLAAAGINYPPSTDTK